MTDRDATAAPPAQAAKRSDEKGCVLKFGIEIVASKDGSIAALLGASPGASTAAPLMLGVREKVFATKVAMPEWPEKIWRIVTGYSTKRNGDPQRACETLAATSEILQLTPPRIEASASTSADAGPTDMKPVPDMAR